MRFLHILAAVALAATSIIVLLFIPHITAKATTNEVCTWIAPADSTPRNWSDSDNWSCDAAPGPGDTAVIDGWPRRVNIDFPVTVERVRLVNGSSLNAYQTMTVTGAMEWQGEIAGGDHLSPTGALESLVIAPGAVLSITNPGDSRLMQGRLVNYGTVEHAADKTLRLFYAVIDNRPGGVYHVSSGRIDKVGLYFLEDGGRFDNAGTFVKDGAGLFTLHAVLSNAGLIDVSSDTLRVELAANTTVVTHTGSFSLTAPGVLSLHGREHRFEPPSSIAGTGTFRVDQGARAMVRGDYDVSGLTDVAHGGALHLDTPGGAAVLSRLNMGNAARLRGTADITVTELMTISAHDAIVEGSSSYTNTLNIAPGARMQVNHAGGLSSRTLNNYGAIEQAGGSCFAMLNNAVFNNHPTGVYTVTAGLMGGCFPATTASRALNNDGRIVKLGAGNFTVLLGVDVVNRGAIEVLDGVLRLDGRFLQTAGELFLNASTFSNQNYGPVLDGGALRGSGLLDLFPSLWLRNNGATVQPTGLLTLNTSYAQGEGGALHVDVGGLTPGVGYSVFKVGGAASLDGRLVLTPTNDFRPASGDVFRVMTYGSRSGEFAQVERGLGLAFGPEYQSGGVLVSDNPALVEFSQRPDRRTMLPGSASGVGLRLTNAHTETISATLKNTLPTGFTFIDGSATSSSALAPPTVTLSNGEQTLTWPALDLAPGAVITIHFGVDVTEVIGSYINTAEVIVTPTDGPQRTIRLPEEVDVSRSPVANTVITVTNALAYPPTEEDGLWRIALRQGSPMELVSVVITSTPVCVLPDCGPLKRFEALHDGQVFPLTLVPGTTDRFRTEIPAGQVNAFERIFLVPVFDLPAGQTAGHLPAVQGSGRCERISGFGYAVYAIWTEDSGLMPCDPVTNEVVFFDPSGYVTDARTGAPIQGATVTLYRVPAALPDTRSTTHQCRTVDTRPGDNWDLLPPATANLGLFEEPGYSPATMDPPINPLRTDETGYYGWDVIRGCWYVKVEAPGYFTRYSAVVGVPPEVTDLHLALEPWMRTYLPVILR